MRIMNSTKHQLLAAAAVLLGIFMAIAMRGCASHHRTSGTSPGTAGPTTNAGGPSVAEVVTRHLRWADQQTAAGLDPQLNPIREFFAEAKHGSRAFAQDALGWDSKWKFVKNYVAGGDDHRRYLAERFAARVFAPENLEKTLRYVIQAYLAHIDNVDAMLLVQLKADLANLPSGSFSAGVDPSVVEQSMRRAIQDAVRAVEADFPGVVGREIVSLIAGEVLTQAGVKLATSAGILSAGASTGAITAGGTIVLSIVADYLVSYVYDKLVDPVGQLSQKLDATLTQLEQIIVNGYGDEPGLHKRLLAYAARRGEARKAAIHSVVRP